jgi:hypothetical protein
MKRGQHMAPHSCIICARRLQNTAVRDGAMHLWTDGATTRFSSTTELGRDAPHFTCGSPLRSSAQRALFPLFFARTTAVTLVWQERGEATITMYEQTK